MSLVLGCPCGRRLDGADDAASIRCPDCGRVLCPITSTGIGALWPRLAFAATATLLGVILVGFLFIRFLLPAKHEAPDRAASVSEKEEKPLAADRGASVREQEEKPLAEARNTVNPLADARGSVKSLAEGAATGKERSRKPLADARGSVKSPTPAKKSVTGPQIGDEFFQEAVITRSSRYRILGSDMGQNVQYVFVSRFRIKAIDADSMTVEQKVEGARLSDADPALQTRLNELLRKMKGATFTITFNARREVTKFEGGPDAIEVFTEKNPLGGPSFLLWSFLDRDGWKELAQLSFFRPPEKIARGEKWERPLTHSWGPLGAWKGKIRYQLSARQGELERYDYLLDLSYKPPGQGGGLPFEIGRSEFRIQTARGAVAYRQLRQRVESAEERFRVQGALTISCLGVDTVVEMDETQRFQLRILDRNPLAK